MSKVIALVGAQYGSEGKGVVSYALRNKVGVAVRTGGPNAGHSFVHDGTLYKMQSIPCTWPNRECALVLGAGAVINPRILQQESKMCGYPTIYVDINASVLEHHHEESEGGVSGEIHHRMGSTGEGVGAARLGRIQRDPKSFRLAATCREIIDIPGVKLVDTVELIHSYIERGETVLLEGTQGCGLSLTHGCWPWVTSADTNAAQMAADAGIPPAWVDAHLVARTYPIRVAGNSGPLYNELSWEEMSKRLGRRVQERTTVTKKVRRVGEWDELLYHRAIMLNDPSSTVLTFLDYLFPEDTNKTSWGELSREAQRFVLELEEKWNCPISMVGTGWNENTGWVHINRFPGAFE